MLRRLPEDYELKIPGDRAKFVSDMKAQKIFIIDASTIGNLKSGNALNAAPILILKLDGKRLLPLFIQSSRYDDPYVFTPDDSKYTWKLGQRIFEGINSMEQTISEHLLQSHLVVEVFAVAAYKALPYNHPIYKARP